MSQLLALDGFLFLSVASDSRAARIAFSSLLGIALEMLDLVGLIMVELLSELAADLVGVLTNSSLVREMPLPEERPMSLLAGLLPGVSLEIGMIPSRIESSFLGVNDNFMATLD